MGSFSITHWLILLVVVVVIFGADMKVDLVNDGPFTIVLDTDNL